MKQILTITLSFIFLSISSTLVAQKTNGNMLSELIATNQGAFKNATVISPFQKQVSGASKMKKYVGDVTLLTLSKDVIKTIFKEKPDALILRIPFKNQEKRIELFKQDLTTADFQALDAKTNGLVASQLGVHYRGIVSGDGKSMAAFSIFDESLMGMFSAIDVGDVNIGQIDETNDDTDYVAYGAKDIDFTPNFICTTPDEPNQVIDIPKGSALGTRSMVTGCVRVSVEVDYDLYAYNGSSIQNTYNYMTGVMNVVAALYQNEQISIKVSQMFIWTIPDTYSADSNPKLDEFTAYRSVFNGDLAALITGDRNDGSALGGRAGLDVLCSKGHGVNDIQKFYSQLPTYSYTVNVIAHEMGHNLGSPHTHSCTWPGGPIDNCAAVEDGSCTPNASNSTHTVMSYCSSPALNNGFGTLPGNLIRSKVQNATCLSASCTITTCANPTNFTVSSLPNGNTANLTWTAASGNTAFTLQYRRSGTSDNWTTINNATSPYVLNTLIPLTAYEIQIQGICGSTTTDFLPSIIFKTIAGSCVPPTGLAASTITASSAQLNWTENAAATAWQIKYGLSGFDPATAGTVVSITTKPYALSGLVANTSYDWYVRSVCAGGPSGYTPYSVVNTFTTPTNVVYCSPTYSLSCTSVSTSGCGVIPYSIAQFILTKSSDNSTVINNMSGNTCVAANSNHANIVGNVLSGQTYNFVASLGSSSPEGCYFPCYIGIWIDYNNDGDFLDANEAAFVGPNTSTNSGSFTIPNTVANGNKRLRVLRSQSVLTVANAACAAYSRGESEDYTLNLTGASSSSVQLSAKVFLQGPYNAGLMNDNLRVSNLIPTTQPYSTISGFSHVGSEIITPSVIAPSVLAVTGNDAIVDWVFIQLRDKSNVNSVLATRAALLQRDGDIVDVNGTSPVTFNIASDNYFVAIRHRNHLGARTVSAVALSNTTTTLDFTTPTPSLLYGTNPQKDLGGGKFGLYMGNVIQDGILKYSGSSNDRLPILTKIGGTNITATVNGYFIEDCNMDGVVKYSGSSNDRLPILTNIGGTNITATIAEQL
jgi:hypothetical protein